MYTNRINKFYLKQNNIFKKLKDILIQYLYTIAHPFSRNSKYDKFCGYTCAPPHNNQLSWQKAQDEIQGPYGASYEL